MQDTLFAGQFHNSSIKETFCGGQWFMKFSGKDICACLAMYDVDHLEQTEVQHCYGGHSVDEVLDSGRDILGEEVLRKGEPDYADVKSYLPKLEKDAFAFLSGALSWSGVVIKAESGIVFPQCPWLYKEMNPLFFPVEMDATLGQLQPKIFLLDGQLPVLFSVHNNDTEVLELMYFVESGDSSRDPNLWIRGKKYQKAAPQAYTLTYRIVSRERHMPACEIPEDMFLDALCNTVGYWIRFMQSGATFQIPEKELQRVAQGTQISCATTFSGDHPHYGHKVYGEEIHDNFPPNYIWSIEMCCLCGREAWARRIWEHMLEYALLYDGHFCYRQGEQEILGASAGDYAYLLFLAGRYRKQLDADRWEKETWDKLIRMGEVILDSCRIHPQHKDRTLVYMCAEADTNTRIHAYLSNNLWTIRGFEALSDLLKSYGRHADAVRFEEMAKKLLESVKAQIAEESIYDARFGKLPPFRFGYTPAPATLSMCRDTFASMSEEAFAKYLQASYMRDQGSDQDLTENSFANYRYYLESLSAMLLDKGQAEAIMKLRENIGGELLGMTRFLERLDDWPVLHYARYLLESGHIDKYIMLLYAHTCHHGRPDLMCYYEQVTAKGEVFLVDCIPSLLTAPIMTAWMFAYETMGDNRLVLLSGIPCDWVQKGCSVKNLGTSDGKLNIAVQENGVTVEFLNPTEKETEIVWRPKEALEITDILQGAEFIEKIQGNRISLKKGILRADIRIKKD